MLCFQCFDAVGKDVQPVKNWWWGAGTVICLERGANFYMAQLMQLPPTVSCVSKIQIGFTFLVPALLGSPGKSVVKLVCVVAWIMLFCVFPLLLGMTALSRRENWMLMRSNVSVLALRLYHVGSKRRTSSRYDRHFFVYLNQTCCQSRTLI